MRAQHYILLIPVAIAITAAAIFLRPADQEGAAVSPSVQRDETAAEAAAARLAEVDDAPERATRQKATEAAAGPLVADDDEQAIDGGPTRSLLVDVAWPAGVEPVEGLVVYALEKDVPLGNMAHTFGSDPDAKRRSEETVFDELEDPRLTATAIRAAVVDEQAATPSDGSSWRASLSVPADRQHLFVHAFGGGAYTERAVEVFAGTESITIVPTRGASLVLVLQPDDYVAEASLAESRVRALIALDESNFAAMGGPDGSRFGVRVALDGAGRGSVPTVPAGVDLEITVRNDDFAPVDLELPGLRAGETRVVEVEARLGAQIRGRVSDSQGRPLAGARVTGSLLGRMFGFDDEVVAETTADEAGEYTLEHLPDGRVVVRADADGALESERVQVEIEDGRSAVDVDIALDEGRAITGTVRLEDGSPAAGAEVTAQFDVAHVAGPGAFGALRGARASGVAAEDGTFRIAGLGAGPFSVRASVTAPDGAAMSGRLDGVRPGAEEVALVLRSPLSIRGVVLDAEDRPLDGVVVHGARIVAGSMGDVRLNDRTTESDAEGRFLLEGLIQGRWDLAVRTESLVSLDETVVELAASTDGVEIRVVPTATITGHVFDTAGNAIADAAVKERTDTAEWMEAVSRDSGGRATRTREDGSYRLVGMRPGTVHVTARATDLSPASTDALELEPGQILENIDLRLTDGGAIEGLCFDDDGQPATGRMVTVQSTTMSVMETKPVEQDGSFTFRGLPEDTYQVIAMDASADLTGDADGGGMANMFESLDMASVEVVEGETALVYLGAPPASPVAVSGEVIRAGEPYANAMVTWLPTASGMMERMKVATTDGDGLYELTLDEPGDYIVSVARMPGGPGQQQTVEFNESVPLDASEHERDFEVPGGAIVGRVIGPDGDPLSGARVSVVEDGGLRTDRMLGGSYAEIQTNAAGEFAAEGLRPGTYQLAAGGASMFGTSATAPARVVVSGISVGENERREGVEVRLPEPGALDVVVRDAAGVGVPDASIFLRDEAGRHTELFSYVVTDGDGKASVTGLAPGRYTVAARTANEASLESASVDVSAGATATANVLLGPAAFVVVQLRAKGDAPVPAGRIQVLDDRDRDVTRRIGLSDMAALYAENKFSLTERRIGPIPLGRYKVLASTEDGRSGKRFVRLDGPGERTVTIVLR